MDLRVLGAGFGRTGTMSLKAALEQLLDGRCYHMIEVFANPDHPDVWARAARGGAVEWDDVLDGYIAAVDWPACAFWRELTSANPDALVVLSTRDSPETWWESASRTIFTTVDELDEDPVPGWRDMWTAVASVDLPPGFPTDPGGAMAAYRAHNAAVRAEVDPDRLVEWRPGDGWEPLCRALGVAVPDAEFPHLNTREEWFARHDSEA